MDIVTKDFPVSAFDATDAYPHGAFEVVLSAPTLDRDGEIVDSKAFEPLPEHITFDTDHSMTCDSVVGSGTPYYAEDGTLRVKGGFASDERSQTIRTKVLEGHIRTTSVTFMAADRTQDDKGIQHVVKAELLNGTFTPVPSNRESVVLTAKSIIAKEGRRNSASDAEMIQAAHDTMVGLGAKCAAKGVTVGSITVIHPDTTASGFTVTEIANAFDLDVKTAPDSDPEVTPDVDATNPVDAPESATETDSTTAEAAVESATETDPDADKTARLTVIENAALLAFDS